MTSTTASIAKVEEAVSEAAMDYDEEKVLSMITNKSSTTRCRKTPVIGAAD